MSALSTPLRLGRPGALALTLALTTCFPSDCAAEDHRGSSGEIVDFERHIAPLFGRLGCNSAACHGAFSGGKGGMQLSLFGYSAEMDFLAIEDRIDSANADASLLLLKPSGQEEHGGGIRFEVGSPPFHAIKRWIDSGAAWQAGSGMVSTLSIHPQVVVLSDDSHSQRLHVTAEFADGTREDVTHLCQFASRDEGVAEVEPDGRVLRVSHGDTSVTVSYGNSYGSASVLAPYPVGDGKKVVPEERGFIDRRINEKLIQLNITASELCTDEEFLRRVMLDTVGAIPTPDEVIRFTDDTRSNKRSRKIDELLADPMHAALWATRMCDITKCDVGEMGDDRLQAARYAQMWHDWFRERFSTNTPYDEIVRGVVTATSREGMPVAEWLSREEEKIYAARDSFANNYADRDTLDLFWRRVNADQEAQLKSNAELTAVAFTGVRLNCAQCHRHPFDRWSQDDYASFANIFSRVICGSSTETNVVIFQEFARRREAKRSGIPTRPLPRIREVFTSTDLGRSLRGSGATPAKPRAFNSREFDEDRDLRQQFYDWLVAPENAYFAPSFVNRVWAAYFGVGLVDPVDDFSVTNPPSHPRLLNELAASFRESGFDIRALEREILLSAAYQRSTTPNISNRSDRRVFARQHVRPMLAEVALDAINKALGTTEDFGGFARAGSLAIEVGANDLTGDAGRALARLGRGKRESTCDCDRRTESDLRQVMFLVNDPLIFTKIKTGTVRELLQLKDCDLVEQLYLSVLGRVPTVEESLICMKHLDEADDDRDAAFDDLVWGLLNTREFITNH